MRFTALMVALALVACGAPSEAPEDASAGATGVGAVRGEPFALEPEALIGLWSFNRDCGLYDLVFDADDLVQYYDYSDESAVVSYRGAWSVAQNNRVVLTMSLIDIENEPTGEVRTFHLDVASTVTDDLIASFGPADGPARDITARRCPDEDRD